jgi:cell division protein FtsB
MLIRVLIATLLLTGLYLQYKYWFSDVGYFRDQTLGEEVEKQRQRLARLEQRNRILAAEVRAQKQGLAAVEARARSDLGMIKEGETFYLVDAQSAVVDKPADTNAAVSTRR